MIIKFREIIRRVKLTGAELPFIGGGLSWDTLPSEKEVAKKLLVYLADKRALYTKWEYEMPPFVQESIIQIRERITNDLQELEQNSMLSKVLRDMQMACLDFLTYTQIDQDEALNMKRIWEEQQKRYFIALGKLRHRFGICISSISLGLGVDVDSRLEPLLPAGALFREEDNPLFER